MWAVLDGTDIHIGTSAAEVGVSDDNRNRKEWHIFDTSTDTWSTLRDEAVSGAPVATTSSQVAVSIGMRSDGDQLLLYTAPSSGAIALRRKEGGTWGTTAIDDSTDNHYGPVLVMGASDRAHCFYFNDTDDSILHRSLSSANALDTEATVDAAVGASVLHPIGRGIAYPDNGNTTIKVPYLHPH
jgi:hypothetical protein